MKIVMGGRRSGKTSELIRASAETGAPIVCFNYDARKCVEAAAKSMGVKIPQPVHLAERMRQDGRNRHGRIIVDEAQLVLAKLLDGRIEAISVNIDGETVLIMPARETRIY